MDPDIWSELLVIRDRLKNSIEQQQVLVNRLQHLQDVVAATQREDTELAKAKAEIDKLETDCDREVMWRKETEHKLAEANTTIDVLRRQCHTVCGWKGRCEKAEQELAEDKAEIERLCDERVEDKTEIGRLRDECKDAWHKLDEARAEITALRKERDGYRADLGEALRGREYQIREKVDASEGLAKAKAEIERLRDTIHHHNERFSSLYAEFIEIKEELESYTNSVNADAEIGRLVRGMRPDSSLHKEGKFYWGEWVGPEPEYEPGYQGAIGCRANFRSQRTYSLIDVLHTIQEVGDDEG